MLLASMYSAEDCIMYEIFFYFVQPSPVHEAAVLTDDIGSQKSLKKNSRQSYVQLEWFLPDEM